MNNLDMSQVIKGKSDQLNVDDIVGTQLMIQVENINITTDPKQPVQIFYIGSAIPFKPCLTVRRILAALWGKDGNQWIGRFMNLYVDQDVDFGNQKQIGGLRVNALSNIEKRATIKLTARRGMKKEYIIEPIKLN